MTLRSRGSPNWPPSAVLKTPTPWSASCPRSYPSRDVRLQVEQHVAGLVVGEERPVHREDVGCGAAGQPGQELVPVGVPVRDGDLDVIVGFAASNDSTSLVWLSISAGSPQMEYSIDAAGPV